MFDKQFPFPTEKSDLIESPDKPILKFDIFYEFYKTAMVWNKLLIIHKKHNNTKTRRKLLKEGKQAEYISECYRQFVQFTQEDERCLQDIID